MFEHTLWDLKQVHVVWVEAILSVWTYPMGFETRRERWQDNPCGVWTYPMGFETSVRKRDYLGFFEFEHTLWDLKPTMLELLTYRSWGLNIPYGIWNSVRRKRYTVYKGFEHTLWDLKLEIKGGRDGKNQFEHTLWDLKLAQCFALYFPVSTCLNIPYGIWNRPWSEAESARGEPFEHTLWDLKRNLRCKGHKSGRVWTYPMGFETACYEYERFSSASCLNIPYGIWNAFTRLS